MAASILYFGSDECNRVAILESAGYAVRECSLIPDLEAALQQPPLTDAVVMDRLKKALLNRALSVIHACPSPAPVIVFPGSEDPTYWETDIELVVPPLTHPDEWLRAMAATIENSRILRERFHTLRSETELLRTQMAEVRSRSILERKRSVRARRIMKALEKFIWHSKPDRSK